MKGLDLRNDTRVLEDLTTYSTTLYTSEALRMIRRHDRAKGPFFLYGAYQAVRTGALDITWSLGFLGFVLCRPLSLSLRARASQCSCAAFHCLSGARSAGGTAALPRSVWPSDRGHASHLLRNGIGAR